MDAIEQLIQKKQDEGHVTHYDRDGYVFILECVTLTARTLGRKGHISARELLSGIFEIAKQRYGVFTYFLFTQWGIRSTGDIGHIVFDLVGHGLLAKQDSDTLEDFSIEIVLKDTLFVSFDEDLKGPSHE